MPALSFRTALMIRVTVVILLTMGIVGLFTFLQVSNTAHQLSDRVLHQTVTLVDGQVTGLLGKASDQVSLLTNALQPSPSEPVNLSTSAQDMVAILRVNTEIGRLLVVSDEDGRSVRVDQLPNGVLEVRTSTFAANGQPVTVISQPYGPGLRPDRVIPGWERDYRKDEEYQKSKDAVRETWSTVTDSRSGDLPGLSVNQQLADARGKFRGEVRATLTSIDLSKFVNRIGVGQSGYACLLQLPDSGPPRVLAYPSPGKILVRNTGITRLATPTEIDDSSLSSFVEAVGNGPRITSRDEAFRYSFASGRVPYSSAIKILGGDSLPQIAVAVVAPYEDFSTPTREIVVFFATFILLALCVGVLVTMVMARRVSQPLAQLATEARHIQSLNLDSAPMRPTRIREIDELASAMETTKSSLRSLQKLVPSEYARFLITSGQEAKLGGERRHITTYFGDIIGFTSLSNDLAPEELMRVLTEYLEVLSNQVLTHGGTIDKFNGDDVMAFWGAPTVIADHALAACRSALASVKAVREMHIEWSDHGRPLLGASFGIATGDVIVGNVGNRQRMNYTVIGDSVNMASRLQGMNKFYGTGVLISQRTWIEAGPPIVARWVDRVRVLGRSDSEDVFELLALREEATERQIAAEALHVQARDHFLARRWDQAEACLNQILATDPHDGPPSIMKAKIASLRSIPLDPDWDGSHQVLGK